MDAAQDIRRRGFKRWYEHRLIHAHLYLVTCFLCMILVASLLEEYNVRAPLASQVPMLVLLAGGGLLGVLSWMRYRLLFAHAEHIADHSTCGACGTYARFDVTAVRGAADSEGSGAPDPTWMRVQCRKCRHEWTIS
jgi:hypothetical protein